MILDLMQRISVDLSLLWQMTTPSQVPQVFRPVVKSGSLRGLAELAVTL